MRQIFKSLVVFAVAASALCACKKDNITAPTSEEFFEVSFTAGMPQTKTAINAEEDGIVWEAEDVAYQALNFFEVVDGTISQVRCSNKGSLVDGVATFTCNIEKKTGTSFQYSALYPYSAFTSYSGKEITFKLKSEQNPSTTSFDKAIDLLITKPFGHGSTQIITPASTTDMPIVQFHRLNALAKMTVKNLAVSEGEKIISVKFEATGVNLAGTGSIDITEDAAEPEWSEQTNYVTANYDQAAVEGNFDVWFSCIPATLAHGTNYTITVKTTLKSYTKNGTIGEKPLVFSEGDVTQFGANFSGVVGEATAVDIPFVFETSVSGGKDALSVIPGIKANGLGSDYSSNDSKLRFDSTNDNIIIRTTSAVGSVQLKGKYNGTSTSSYLEVLGSINGEEFTQIQKINCAETSSNVTFDLTTSNDIDANYRFIKINYTKNIGNVGLGYIKLSAPDTTPKIIAIDITDVDATGVDAEIADYTVLNFEDDVIVSEFTGCVKSAEIVDNSILYGVSANYSGAKSYGTIVISSVSHPEATKTINVSQSADKFSVNPSSITLAAEAMDIVSFEVTSTYDFNITNPDEEKIDISKSGPVEGKYTVEVMSLVDNTSGEVDLIGNIVLTRITEEDTPKKLDVTVIQLAPAGAKKTYTLTIPASLFSGSYVESDKTITATEIGGEELEVTIHTKDVMKNSSNVQVKSKTGYIYNKTNLGEIISIETTNPSGKGTVTIYQGNAEQPNSSAVSGISGLYTFSANKGYFAIKGHSSNASQMESIVITFTK